MDNASRRKLVSRGTFTIGALALISLVALAYDSAGRRQRLLETAQLDTRRRAAQGAQEIGSQLQSLMPPIDALAADLSSGKLTEATLRARLRAVLDMTPDTFEVGIASAPYAWSPKVRLYAPHLSRSNGAVTEFQLEQSYDYTEHDWYRLPMEQGRARWGEPYFGQATQSIVVGYSAPFHLPGTPEGKPSGVVRINLSLDGIRRMVSHLGFGQTGYAFLLSGKGVFLASPIEENVTRQRTIADFAQENGAEEYREFGERALRGERVQMKVRSATTGREIWAVSEPVVISGWALGAVFFQDEIAPDPIKERQGLIRMMVGGVLVMALFILGLCHARAFGVKAAWYAVGALSLLLVVGISFVWGVTLHFPTRQGDDGVRILEPSSLRKFLGSQSTGGERGEQGAWVEIPTGVLIQGVWHVDASSVDVSGYVWQRYPAQRAGGLTQGVELPEAGTIKLREVFRRKQADTEVVGWFFEARLRSPSMSSHKYPFDSALVRLRLRHPDLDKGVLLTPDLEAYPYLAPSTLPGVDQSLHISGWKLERSYFSYARGGQATSFGIASSAKQGGQLELCFNLRMQRQFLDPFIAAILPLVVASCLLFMLVMVGTKDKARVAATGFKATDILRGCISLLFPVVFAQINMRTKIASSDFIYLEYFYFVVYGAILLITINALVFTMKERGLAQLHDNLVPKLLFWPLLLGAFFVVTLVFLY